MAAFHKGTRESRVRERKTNMETKEKEKGKHSILQSRSRGHRFTWRASLRRRRLPHPLLKSTHKTPDWEQQPVQRSRWCFDMRFSASTRPHFRVIFIRLPLSFLRASRQRSWVNSSRLCRSYRQWRAVLRLLGATGANIGGTGGGAMSTRLMQRRTVIWRTHTQGL